MEPKHSCEEHQLTRVLSLAPLLSSSLPLNADPDGSPGCRCQHGRHDRPTSGRARTPTSPVFNPHLNVSRYSTLVIPVIPHVCQPIVLFRLKVCGLSLKNSAKGLNMITRVGLPPPIGPRTLNEAMNWVADTLFPQTWLNAPS